MQTKNTFFSNKNKNRLLNKNYRELGSWATKFENSHHSHTFLLYSDYEKRTRCLKCP